MSRHRPAWLLPTLFWIGVVVLAGAIGRHATPTSAGVAGGPRPMARIPPPPPDLPTLLYQLGVGSVVWYAAVFSLRLPLLLLLLLLAARRIDTESLGRPGVMAIVAGGTTLLIAATSAMDYGWTYRSATSPPALAAWLPISLRQHVLPWVALAGAVAAIEARRRTLRATKVAKLTP